MSGRPCAGTIDRDDLLEEARFATPKAQGET